MPEIGVEAEVPSASEAIYVGGIHREFGRGELVAVGGHGVQLAQRTSQSCQIATIGIGHDVEIHRWSRLAVRGDGDIADDDVGDVAFVQEPQ